MMSYACRLCIVSYLYIYITSLAEHTNHKRFQCERPNKKSNLERTKTGTRLTTLVNKEESVKGGVGSKVEGQKKARVHVLPIEVLAGRTKRSCRSSEHSKRTDVAEDDKTDKELNHAAYER